MKYISCINKYKSCIEPGLLPDNPPQPPFFCKLVLNDDSVVELEGSGELTQAMVGIQYQNLLVSAEIGELCTSITNGAFVYCSNLTSVTIPSSVTTINNSAFQGCSSLTSIGSKDSNASVKMECINTYIGEGAFQNCSGLTRVSLPNGVTTITSSAFASCSSLTEVTIPSSVTSIGAYAFSGCTSLTTIISHIMSAPSVDSNTFASVKNGGTLYVPIGSSGYETWMNNQGNLGSYGWTKVEQ